MWTVDGKAYLARKMKRKSTHKVEARGEGAHTRWKSTHKAEKHEAEKYKAEEKCTRRKHKAEEHAPGERGYTRRRSTQEAEEHAHGRKARGERTQSEGALHEYHSITPIVPYHHTTSVQYSDFLARKKG